jgi:hypothetical protein
MGTWADNRTRILAAVDDLPETPGAVSLVVDQEGRDTGFALLRGLITKGERRAFDRLTSTHRLIGVMQWWGFPVPEYSWGGETYEITPEQPADDPWGIPEIAACEAWMHCTRDPRPWLPPDKPQFMVNNSDFVDADAVWETAYGPWPDPVLPKRWDVVCSYSGHWYDEIQKNWSLGRRCVERLSGDLGLSVLLLARNGIPDVPDLPNVEVRPRVSWDESIGCLARSRLTLLPNHMDPSPRLITESLAVGTPVLAHADLLGGWQYVQPETGRFFDSEYDVAVEALCCLSTDYDTRAWLERSYGRDRAARALASYLRAIGGPKDLHYALPTSLFR